jgi:hypothetical protein
MRKLVILSLFAFACGEAATGTAESAINKGVEDSSLVKQVLMLETGGGTCSSAVIHYPRCIVTAAHCGQPTQVDGGKTKPFLDGKHQLPELYRKHDGAQDKRPEHDLAISWLKNLTTGSIERLQVSDYDAHDPLPAGATSFQNLSIESIDGKQSNDPLNFFEAKIAGYGLFENKDPDPLDIGVLRSGDVYVTNYYGVAFRSRAKASENRICAGDSGGPMIFGGSILGIASVTDRHACNDKGFEYHTAFNTTKLDKNDAAANYDWTMDTVEELCTKWQTVKIDGQGTVAGTIAPVQARAVGGDRGNSSIQCPGDCAENFHGPAPSRAAQSMTLNAQASDGWTFSHWSSESKIRKCQCDGSGDTSCNVAEGPMGYYDPDTSIDEDVCIAHFTQDSDGGDAGYDSGDGDDGGGGSDGGVDADAGESD